MQSDFAYEAPKRKPTTHNGTIKINGFPYLSQMANLLSCFLSNLISPVTKQINKWEMKLNEKLEGEEITQQLKQSGN